MEDSARPSPSADPTYGKPLSQPLLTDAARKRKSDKPTSGMLREEIRVFWTDHYSSPTARTPADMVYDFYLTVYGRDEVDSNQFRTMSGNL